MDELAKQHTKAWVANWLTVGPKLEAIRRRELQNMTCEQRTKAIESVLQLGSLHAKPRTTSGLVEQQRLFRKVHLQQGER